jgi:hypothetical protein
MVILLAGTCCWCCHDIVNENYQLQTFGLEGCRHYYATWWLYPG